MSKLLEYFNVVDKNAIARAAHQTAPVASMSAFGLSAREQEAILSNDRQSLAEELGVDNIIIFAMHTPNTVFQPGSQILSGNSAS